MASAATARSKLLRKVTDTISLLCSDKSVGRGKGVECLKELLRGERDQLVLVEEAMTPSIWGRIVLGLLGMMRLEMKAMRSRGKVPISVPQRAAFFKNAISSIETIETTVPKLSAGRVHKDVVEHICLSLQDKRAFLAVAQVYTNVLVLMLRRYCGAMETSMYATMLEMATSTSTIRGIDEDITRSCRAQILKALLQHHAFTLPAGSEVPVFTCIVKWFRIASRPNSENAFIGENEMLEVFSGLCSSLDASSLRCQIRFCMPHFHKYAVRRGCLLSKHAPATAYFLKCASSALRFFALDCAFLDDAMASKMRADFCRSFQNLDTFVEKHFRFSTNAGTSLYAWDCLPPLRKARWQFLGELFANAESAGSLIPNSTGRLLTLFAALSHSPFRAARLVNDDTLDAFASTLGKSFSIETLRIHVSSDIRRITLTSDQMMFVWCLQCLLPLSFVASNSEKWPAIIEIVRVKILPAMCHILSMSVVVNSKFVTFIVVCTRAIFTNAKPEPSVWKFVDVLMAAEGNSDQTHLMSLISLLLAKERCAESVGKERRRQIIEWAMAGAKRTKTLGFRDTCARLIVSLFCHRDIEMCCVDMEARQRWLKGRFGVLCTDEKSARRYFREISDDFCTSVPEEAVSFGGSLIRDDTTPIISTVPSWSKTRVDAHNLFTHVLSIELDERKQLATLIVEQDHMVHIVARVYSILKADRLLEEENVGIAPGHFLLETIEAKMEALILMLHRQTDATMLELNNWIKTCGADRRGTPFDTYNLSITQGLFTDLNIPFSSTFDRCLESCAGLILSKRSLAPGLRSINDVLIGSSRSQNSSILSNHSATQFSQFDSLDSDDEDVDLVENDVNADDKENESNKKVFEGSVHIASVFASLALCVEDSKIVSSTIDRAIVQYFDDASLSDEVLVKMLQGAMRASTDAVCASKNTSLFFSRVKRMNTDDSIVWSSPMSECMRLFCRTLPQYDVVTVKEVLLCNSVFGTFDQYKGAYEMKVTLPLCIRNQISQSYGRIVSICLNDIDSADVLLDRMTGTIIRTCLDCDQGSYAACALLEAYPDGRANIFGDILLDACERCIGSPMVESISKFCDNVGTTATPDSEMDDWWAPCRRLCLFLAETMRHFPKSFLAIVTCILCDTVLRVKEGSFFSSLIEQIVEETALRMGFHDAAQFFTSNAFPILRKWITARDHSEFPYSLFNISAESMLPVQNFVLCFHKPQTLRHDRSLYPLIAACCDVRGISCDFIKVKKTHLFKAAHYCAVLDYVAYLRFYEGEDIDFMPNNLVVRDIVQVIHHLRDAVLSSAQPGMRKIRVNQIKFVLSSKIEDRFQRMHICRLILSIHENGLKNVLEENWDGDEDELECMIKGLDYKDSALSTFSIDDFVSTYSSAYALQRKSIAVCVRDLRRCLKSITIFEPSFFRKNGVIPSPYLDRMQLDGSEKGVIKSENVRHDFASILFFFCKHNIPECVRFEAMRCIGALGLEKSSNAINNIEGRVDPYSQIVSYLAAACIADPLGEVDSSVAYMVLSSVWRAIPSMRDKLSPCVRRELSSLFGTSNEADEPFFLKSGKVIAGFERLLIRFA